MLRRILGVALVVAVVVSTAGCSQPNRKKNTDDAPVSFETTRTFDNSDKRPPSKVAVPPPPMLRNPRSAVYSYSLWISFAYRVMNSDVATIAFSPYEEVRVNSYVQYNKEKGRALDQVLREQKVKQVKQVSETTATVATAEKWKYRYIDINSGAYDGPWLDATYDVTYTVVYDRKRPGWLVDKVDALPKGTVK